MLEHWPDSRLHVCNGLHNDCLKMNIKLLLLFITMSRVLLLENIHKHAEELLVGEGFEVNRISGSLTEDQLCEILVEYEFVGIRSATSLTERVLRTNPHLRGVGCFCIGTNQVDLDVAKRLGIPVFNSPYSNSRSVAELIICQIISLSRCLGDRNKEMHNGIWNKTAKNCYEIRGKTLGIVGYGHVGSQLSVLAENMGMNVIYYDIEPKLAHGNAKVQDTLDDLLMKSEFVSLHVPLTELTRRMIGKEQLEKMKCGGYLLNASRGEVVILEDLVDSIKSGYLSGAYLDVYPKEPKMNCDYYEGNECCKGVPNLIMTPHIGGSTEEAQWAIAEEVSRKFIGYYRLGTTIGSVNFPQLNLMLPKNCVCRIVNIHYNVPGVLKKLNQIIDETINVVQQFLSTDEIIGYIVFDVEGNCDEIIKRLNASGEFIRSYKVGN